MSHRSAPAPGRAIAFLAAAALALAAVATVVAAPVGASGAASDAPSDAARRSAPPLRVLLIGNSHLLMPGFASALERALAARVNPRRAIDVRTIARIGTTLTKSRRRSETAEALGAQNWDVIVLQESTTAFMTTHGRSNFAAAAAWFAENRPKRAAIVLWQPWPQGASHALYSRRGVWGRWFPNPPRDPDQLLSWITSDIARVAAANRLFIAPIGTCWMQRPANARPYARDDYHPSPRGIRFIAAILASSIIDAAQTEATQTGANEAGRTLGTCPPTAR